MWCALSGETVPVVGLPWGSRRFAKLLSHVQIERETVSPFIV
ncbi:hypothetical protein AtDm6_0268 [Acetobacter tropicalis]|uniref:Uncharacterized protein n=1 Tax=Acetobacter tropicalis TaxID=104102 RepID=A0A094ZWD8_9PROT|nr:hypothetical protein AtDm6_0268 [Acetobacter tropicalis]